ncbi:hypothetical protein ABPG72_016821 [Tetrahymena utriculariae]
MAKIQLTYFLSKQINKQMNNCINNKLQYNYENIKKYTIKKLNILTKQTYKIYQQSTNKQTNNHIKYYKINKQTKKRSYLIFYFNQLSQQSFLHHTNSYFLLSTYIHESINQQVFQQSGIHSFQGFIHSQLANE